MRYPSNYRQELAPDYIATLPPFASYEGDAPDLRHLRGLLIPTKDIEKLVYVGERENVYVDLPTGVRGRPWLGAYIYRVDANGEVDPEWHDEPLPHPQKNPMSRAELGELGFTDESLASLAKEQIGETYVPDRSGPSDRRREVFERTMAAVWG